MDYSDVYSLLHSESVSHTGPFSKTPLGKVDEYLHDINLIIENDNPVSLTDIKLLANAARHELESIPNLEG